MTGNLLQSPHMDRIAKERSLFSLVDTEPVGGPGDAHDLAVRRTERLPKASSRKRSQLLGCPTRCRPESMRSLPTKILGNYRVR